MTIEHINSEEPCSGGRRLYDTSHSADRDAGKIDSPLTISQRPRSAECVTDSAYGNIIEDDDPSSDPAVILDDDPFSGHPLIDETDVRIIEQMVGRVDMYSWREVYTITNRDPLLDLVLCRTHR